MVGVLAGESRSIVFEQSIIRIDKSAVTGFGLLCSGSKGRAANQGCDSKFFIAINVMFYC